jgi:hypothetical protein
MGRPKKQPPPEVHDNRLWFIWLVRYWVPFPASEYGGLQCIVARDAEEAKKVILEDGLTEAQFQRNSSELIDSVLKRADIIPLREEYEHPHIIRQFTT